MSRFRAGLILLAGLVLLAAALALQAILLETVLWTLLLAAAGAGLTAWGGFALRSELGALLRRRRGEIVFTTLGVVGVLIALGYLSARYPLRFDLTEARLYSLSGQTDTMLQRLEKPVHIVFFHDRLMRKTVELYELFAASSPQVTVEFHDPTLNPAQARMLGVQFAGTAVMQSGERRLQVNGDTETHIANGILRVTQGAKQRVCFLGGHMEADPFSKEAHDHLEGSADHQHGLGAKYVLHERHGLAKARHALENFNYEVTAVSLVQGGDVLDNCVLLVLAGPKVALLPRELATLRAYLAAGGNAFFMIDPFVQTGLEPILLEFGVVLDETIVIDDASHFWADASAPAVTSYSRHEVTRDLPLTFYPGARSLSPTFERVPGTSVWPIVNSSKSSYGETDPDRAAFDEARDLSGPATLMVIAVKRPATTTVTDRVLVGAEVSDASDAADAAGGFTGRSRIAVIGDSDFATNSFFHFLGNGNLFLNTVNYLAAQEDLIGIEPRSYDLPRLSVTNRQMKATFILAVMLVPALLALAGVAVWWRQR